VRDETSIPEPVRGIFGVFRIWNGGNDDTWLGLTKKRRQLMIDNECETVGCMNSHQLQVLAPSTRGGVCFSRRERAGPDNRGQPYYCLCA